MLAWFRAGVTAALLVFAAAPAHAAGLRRRAQQWRVSDNQFACNEFCAEGVEEQAKGRGQ